MQRDACLEFIQQQGWEVYKEYVESGVSAYNTDLKDREKLQEMMQDAYEGRFDILLVFMSDRLSRKTDEPLKIIEIMGALGIEIWSVNEGRLDTGDFFGDIMNQFRFYIANAESKKIGGRVYSGRKSATGDGRFTGGRVPYGYQLVSTGIENRKGRIIRDIVKEPKESNVVEIIYNQLVDHNMSLNGIIKYLNADLGIRTRDGYHWNTSSVRNILKNPINKGYISYGKTRKKEIIKNIDIKNLKVDKVKRQRSVPSGDWIIAKEQNKDLIIVSEEKWQMAQEILARRYKKHTDPLGHDGTWKSSLLLVGLLECGFCHGKISSSAAYQKSISKRTGEEKRYRTEFYKCNTRGRGKDLCASKSYISRAKLEAVVLNEVYCFLDRMESVDCSKEIQETILSNSQSEKEELQSLEKELVKNERAFENMKRELHCYYAGESNINPEVINDLIGENRKSHKSLMNEIDSLKKNINSKEVMANEFKQTGELFPVWREVFSTAPLNVKKHLLSIMIEKIVVKGSEVDIFFKADMDTFLNIMI